MHTPQRLILRRHVPLTATLALTLAALAGCSSASTSPSTVSPQGGDAGTSSRGASRSGVGVSSGGVSSSGGPVSSTSGGASASETFDAGAPRHDGSASAAKGDAGDDAARSSSSSSSRGGSDAGRDGAPRDGGAHDAGRGDAGHEVPDAGHATPDSGAAPDTGNGGGGSPAVYYVGRFDTRDPAGPRMAWPGTRIVAAFDGTGASVQLTQTDGYSGGPSWFDVVIDGSEAAPFSVTGTGTVIQVVSGLQPGAHVLQLEKRTEANLGVVRFEGFTFTGGSGLLAPPAPAPRRIEFLADSTIDGYGILGDVSSTCTTGDPPQYNDSRSSLAFVAASALNAEMVLSAYSGKGLTVNEASGDTEYFQDLYPRAIPDDSGSVWTFQTEIPDAVVLSLGGVDLDGQSSAPPGFQSAYDALVGTVRGHYPNAAIFLTVWSQITNDTASTRTAMTDTLQAIVNARKSAGDQNIFLYSFPEATDADQTACEDHATVAFESQMAGQLVTEMKQTLGW